MFTVVKSSQYTNNTVLINGACLSTDSKPTTGIANGSMCLEIDTGKLYAYNEDDGEWVEQPGAGGGGGSGNGTGIASLILNTRSFSNGTHVTGSLVYVWDDDGDWVNTDTDAYANGELYFDGNAINLVKWLPLLPDATGIKVAWVVPDMIIEEVVITLSGDIATTPVNCIVSSSSYNAFFITGSASVMLEAK